MSVQALVIGSFLVVTVLLLISLVRHWVSQSRKQARYNAHRLARLEEIALQQRLSYATTKRTVDATVPYNSLVTVKTKKRESTQAYSTYRK